MDLNIYQSIVFTLEATPVWTRGKINLVEEIVSFLISFISEYFLCFSGLIVLALCHIFDVSCRVGSQTPDICHS